MILRVVEIAIVAAVLHLIFDLRTLHPVALLALLVFATYLAIKGPFVLGR